MTTRLLLDTCAIIWIGLWQAIDAEAQDALRAAAHSPENVTVSPISAWELGLLVARGRLPAVQSPMALFNDVLRTDGVRMEPLTPEVLVESSFLPGDLHRDPADRILVATARARDMTIVTRDRLILDYAERGHVRALAC